MSRLAVDPAVLAVAGVGLIGVGEGLVPAVTALSVAFNANTGQDAAGVVFGRHYQDAGRAIMTSVATGINALLRTGYGVQVSAVNYSRAEANSDLSRRAQALESPPCPADVSVPGGPSPLGGGVGEPALWAVVELLVGDLWPNGSPTQMRAAATAWRSFASVLYGVSGGVAGPYNTVAAQEIPEGEAVKKTIRDIDGVFGQLAMGCEGLATAVEGFAADVENTQNAIRRLLAKLGSIGSIVGIFFEFVRGHGEEELAKIAADIRTVMDHLKGEAAAKKAMMAQALADFEALNQAMRIVADRQFTEFFGEDVGSVLSGLWQAGGDIDRGIARWTASTVEGLEDLNPVRAFYDPQGALQTWKGLAQMAQVVTNPAADPELTKEIAKGLLRVQEWKTQRPLTALTENALDIGTLFLGPEAAAGGVAKVGELSDVAKVADLAEGVRPVAGLGELSEATRAVGALDRITSRTAELTRSLDKSTTLPVEKPPAPPAIDKSAAGPVADKPSVGGTPVSPDKASPLPGSPVESKANAPTAASGAKATDTPANIKPYGNDTAAATVSEHPPAPAAPAETPGPTGTPGAAGSSVGLEGDSVLPKPVEGFDYGFSPSNALENLKDPSSEIARLQDAGVPRRVLEGYEPLAGRTVDQFRREFTVESATGDLKWDWEGQAPNDGFAGTPRVVDHIPEGVPLDRLGWDEGGFMADAGAPLSDRAMPPGVAGRYHQYMGTGLPVPDGMPWEVRYGPAKEAFGQRGGACQWVVVDVSDPAWAKPVRVKQLVDAGMIREVGP